MADQVHIMEYVGPETEPEDMTDENIWGFLGDVFESLAAIQWDGAQVLLLLLTALVPVIVFCFYHFIKVRYATKGKD